MPTRVDIRNSVRQMTRLWPDRDALSGAISASTNPIGVTTGTLFTDGGVLEIGSEVMLVRSVSGNNVTVRRGDRGTTATSHSAGAVIHIYGQYEPTNVDLNVLVRDAINWLYPVVCLDVWDDSPTTVAGEVSYAIPTTIEVLEEVYMSNGKTPVSWAHLQYWSRSGSRILFPQELPADRKLKFHGQGRFTQPTSDSTELDFGEDLLGAVQLYVLAMVVKSQEIHRTKFTGQSALLESRSGTIPDLIGSSRDLMRLAEGGRQKAVRARSAITRRMFRHA